MPKISVIMPAYNAEKYIAEAIDSILGQTFGDFEFIILNDCSKDRTEEIILSYDDSRIVYLKNEKNMGVAATLNRGLSVAQGEYIARMDADDISLPERFEKQVAYMEANQKTAALGGNAVIFREDGAETVTDMPCDFGDIQLRIAISNPFIHPTMMLRRSVLEDAPYERAFDGREDYRLWMKLSQRYELQNLPEKLIRYRYHSGQVTQQKDTDKAKKHFFLKELYYQELEIGLTKPMTDALCHTAYYGKVVQKQDLLQLKRGLQHLSEHYGYKNLPGEYEQVLISTAIASGVTFQEFWQLTAGVKFRERFGAIIRFWKG